MIIMRLLRATILPALLFLSLATANTGCDRASGPPEPIAIEELPGALAKTFAKAKPETKDLVTKVADSLKSQNFSKAYGEIQTLAGTSGLNREQTTLVTRGVLCLNNALQAAQSSGDQKAAETLRIRRATK